MAKLKAWWRGIVDDIQVLGSRWVGVLASIVLPGVFTLALGLIAGRWPELPGPSLADLARVVGALLVAVILQVRQATNDADGDLSKRTSKEAMKRRRKAGFASGFAWQAGIAELQRQLTPAVAVALRAMGLGGAA